MTQRIFLLLGSNLGDRPAILAAARTALEEKVGKITKKSSLYETAAWGMTGQPHFLNQVLALETSLLVNALLSKTQRIEVEAGRKREAVWGPRTLDIDILLYGDSIIRQTHLEIPHPRLHLRRFTLLPLAEIAPDLEHPQLKQTITQLIEACPDSLPVRLFQP